MRIVFRNVAERLFQAQSLLWEPHDCSSVSSSLKTPLRSQKLRCCKSIVHSVLVNRSKSSSEKSTGLSKELCRLGDRQASAANSVRSGSADDAEETEEPRCSEKEGSGPVWLSCRGTWLSLEFVAPSEWCWVAVQEPDTEGSGWRSAQPRRPPSSVVGCALSPLSLA